MAALTTLCTAITSLPSTWTPGKPAATAFWASVAVPLWAANGTEMAHWLLLTTNTTGRRFTPAKFMAS